MANVCDRLSSYVPELMVIDILLQWPDSLCTWQGGMELPHFNMERVSSGAGEQCIDDVAGGTDAGGDEAIILPQAQEAIGSKGCPQVCRQRCLTLSHT